MGIRFAEASQEGTLMKIRFHQPCSKYTQSGHYCYNIKMIDVHWAVLGVLSATCNGRPNTDFYLFIEEAGLCSPSLTTL